MLFFIVLIPPFSAVSAGQYFEFSDRATVAYQKIISLQLESGGQLVQELKQQEPDNLIAVYLDNYLEVIRIGVDDNETAYHKFSKNLDTRLFQLSRGEPRSPYYRFTQAEIRLQWAALRARFGDYLACASDVKLAYALLEENERRFPDFIANKKSLGILHALVGNVPDEYRWAVRLLGGMKGTIQQGIAELERVVAFAKSHEFIWAEESLLVYALLQQHLNNQGESAWNTLKNSPITFKSNPLFAFTQASIGMRNGHTDEAIQLLQQLPAGLPYHPFHQPNFLLGVAKLNRLDPDADVPLQAFLQAYKGNNGVKEAWQKLAWQQLLQGNTEGYYSFMWRVKQTGAARSEPDKVALREANAAEIPDVRLLQARLLFDGSYFTRAFDLLKNHRADYANHTRNNLEYQYRMGRISHKLGKIQDAKTYYQSAIDAGEKLPWYFACNAALQLGLLHEGLSERSGAQLWYKKCLSISPKEYAGSLHAKAKAGLNRLH